VRAQRAGVDHLDGTLTRDLDLIARVCRRGRRRA
jgi:hypothetical protein